ncbi:MAG: GNAT family N-acetyltransferase [Actinobacteria bacterium]|nr:GNAT family N-acetyltransferase [Actinomycetota bacterium]
MSRIHSDVGVRQAGAGDAETVGRIQAELWRDAYADDLPPQALAVSTAEAFAAAWRASLTPPTQPDHALLLAHAGGDVVGLVALGPSEDPDLAGAGAVELLVGGVAVHRRGAGHGSRLLAAATDLARDRGAGLLTAWVLVSHERTRTFLQGAGFGPDRARRERIVDPDGRTVLEARFAASIAPDPAAAPRVTDRSPAGDESRDSGVDEA